ncbi:hypothetical protein ACQ4LH_22235, partial [Pseudomonas peli]
RQLCKRDRTAQLPERLSSITPPLRASARRDRHAPESVALQPAIDDALALLAKRRQAMQVELIRDLPNATPWDVPFRPPLAHP